MQRSSNALTIIPDTFPKKAPETAACRGFANANERSRERSVGPASLESVTLVLVAALAGVGGGIVEGVLLGCGDQGDAA